MDPTPPLEAPRPSRPSLGLPGSSRRRQIFFAISAAMLVGALALFREVLAPFALALIVAYVLEPVVAALERARIAGRALPRWVAVVLVYVCLLGGLAAGLAFAAPRLAAEVGTLAQEGPRMIHTVQDDWVPRIDRALRDAAAQFGGPAATDGEATARPTDEDAEPAGGMRVVPLAGGGFDVQLPPEGIEVRAVGESGYRVVVGEREREGGPDIAAVVVESARRFFRDTEAYAGTAVRAVQSFVAKIVSGVFRFFIMLMLSAYILITRDRIRAFFRSLWRPSRRSRFDELVSRIDRGLAGVVRGQLLIALVNGVLSGIGFWLADLRYWPVLTLIATLLSVIPIFGAILSTVPAVIVGIEEGVGTALFVLAWIIGIHQIEANLLNPKIMGDAAKVHPVLVVFALLAGEHTFGILGALLAVPLLSITQSVFLHFKEVALGGDEEPDGLAPIVSTSD